MGYAGCSVYWVDFCSSCLPGHSPLQITDLKGNGVRSFLPRARGGIQVSKSIGGKCKWTGYLYPLRFLSRTSSLDTRYISPDQKLTVILMDIE